MIITCYLDIIILVIIKWYLNFSNYCYFDKYIITNIIFILVFVLSLIKINLNFIILDVEQKLNFIILVSIIFR